LEQGLLEPTTIGHSQRIVWKICKEANDTRFPQLHTPEVSAESTALEFHVKEALLMKRMLLWLVPTTTSNFGNAVRLLMQPWIHARIFETPNTMAAWSIDICADGIWGVTIFPA
jgi:hypothetical protein